ncbi:hypothetical protein MPTK1_8g13220 [Marchantia polymorpha subsp. ruderalis]|uniref:Uncharacterized protein n=1 Tax=Marchantia polymorpha TaxID=3197 RepID=A0A2R6WCE3_MARPO|nr:hypothetical protein MARPO_0110s0003 [Marchantia polymorpha]|eukprot:PTQ31509.1 hypothetical protein MARPO_0110s0003 [Marchantia polymorpha]
MCTDGGKRQMFHAGAVRNFGAPLVLRTKPLDAIHLRRGLELVRTVSPLVYEQHRSLSAHLEPSPELCLSRSKLVPVLEVCPRHYLSVEFCASAPGGCSPQTITKLHRCNRSHKLLPGPFDSQDKNRSASDLHLSSTTLSGGNPRPWNGHSHRQGHNRHLRPVRLWSTKALCLHAF